MIEAGDGRSARMLQDGCITDGVSHQCSPRPSKQNIPSSQFEYQPRKMCYGFPAERLLAYIRVTLSYCSILRPKRNCTFVFFRVSKLQRTLNPFFRLCCTSSHFTVCVTALTEKHHAGAPMLFQAEERGEAHQRKSALKGLAFIFLSFSTSILEEAAEFYHERYSMSRAGTTGQSTKLMT
jgi:hypothetical protein